MNDYKEYTGDEMINRSYDFYDKMKTRRSTRQFSVRDFPRDILTNCIKAAATSPSGANKQPWFIAIVKDPNIKRQIRREAEKAEKKFYENKSAQKWHEDLKKLNTNFTKPFLEQAPYLLIIFAKTYDLDEHGGKKNNYYVKESVGIMTGILLSALHFSGLAALTYTPSKTAFLNKILGRPKNERPFMILPVGYKAESAATPQIKKKSLEEISVLYE